MYLYVYMMEVIKRFFSSSSFLSLSLSLCFFLL